MYEKPSIKVLVMEAEPVMGSMSSLNTTGDPDNPGFDIVDGNPEEEGDGTDLEKNGAFGVKSHSVWD